MKTTKIIVIAMGVSSLAALTSLSAPPAVTVQVPGPPVQLPGPPVQLPGPPVQAPGPTVTVPVPVPEPPVTVEAVPDTYVWDGNEYVGIVGTQYYYLGPGNVWLAINAPRLARFQAWERVHPDWRVHAIRNELYRHDARGHFVPRHDHRDHNQ